MFLWINAAILNIKEIDLIPEFKKEFLNEWRKTWLCTKYNSGNITPSFAFLVYLAQQFCNLLFDNVFHWPSSAKGVGYANTPIYFRSYHIAIYYLHLIRPHHCLLEHDNFLISLFLASLSLGASNMVIRLVKVIHTGRLTDLAPDFIIWIIQVQISRNYLRYAGNAKIVSGIDTENEVQSKYITQNKIFMTILTTKAQKTHLTEKYNARLLIPIL